MHLTAVSFFLNIGNQKNHNKCCRFITLIFFVFLCTEGRCVFNQKVTVVQ